MGLTKDWQKGRASGGGLLSKLPNCTVPITDTSIMGSGGSCPAGIFPGMIHFHTIAMSGSHHEYRPCAQVRTAQHAIPDSIV